MEERQIQIIKGAGDIGSAIAHRIKRAGLRPVLLEGPRPPVTRRRMAFASALHLGEAILEGLRGVQCKSTGEVRACLEKPDCLPVFEAAGAEVDLPELHLPEVNVVVDARMRKKQTAQFQMNEAPLVIGIGPGFSAGTNVHAVVESNWGKALGKVIWEGRPMDYTGIHRKVEGKGAERYLYAPQEGVFHTSRDILEIIEAGEVVGRVNDTSLVVKISGLLRGLVHDGTEVVNGAKLVEVDPRAEVRHCIGIGERPGRISEGVLFAIKEKLPGLFEGL